VNLMLDPAPAVPVSQEILQHVSWFTPNETEAGIFADQIDPALAGAEPERLAQAFIKTGVGAVALKLGARGVLIADGSEPRLLPAPRVTAVDSTAAGDAFNGAFATGLMLGMDAFDAARFACGAAALSVTRRGAQPSMPARAEVESFLHEAASLRQAGAVQRLRRGTHLER